MANVLVTGGAGYIGSHTCKLLFQAGYNPITYDNLSFGHEWAVQWGPLEVGDINDYERLVSVINEYKPVAVIHFAAFAYVGESVTDPAKYYVNNVSGGLNLLKAMRDNGLKNIIFSSSCATYGIPEQHLIDESTEQKPINPYGRTKLIFEQVLSDFEKAYGINSVSLRYFNAAGADPECEIGEWHKPEPHLIPTILNVALGEIPELSIFGNDYETFDGTCIRDYIHVWDLADAHLKALEYILNADKSQVLNLGTGEGYSIKQVLSIAESVVNKKIAHKFNPRRPGDPPKLVADPRKAFEILKWKTAQSEMYNIIKTAWMWHQKITHK